MFICTAENPWTLDNPDTDVSHPDVKCICREYSSSEEVYVYKCPHCGKIIYEVVVQ